MTNFDSRAVQPSKKETIHWSNVSFLCNNLISRCLIVSCVAGSCVTPAWWRLSGSDEQDTLSGNNQYNKQQEKISASKYALTTQTNILCYGIFLV